MAYSEQPGRHSVGVIHARSVQVLTAAEYWQGARGAVHGSLHTAAVSSARGSSTTPKPSSALITWGTGHLLRHACKGWPPPQEVLQLAQSQHRRQRTRPRLPWQAVSAGLLLWGL